jgi:hypothetical protein
MRALEFLRSWEAIPTKEIIERINAMRAPGAPKHGIREIVLRNEVRPSDLFCYLGARFGEPNGIQNYLRADHSDNLIHWEWSLQAQSLIVNVQGQNFRTSVWFLGDAPGIESLSASDLAKAFKRDFGAYGEDMSNIRNHLEHWTEFVNPYQRIRRSLTQLLDKLRELRLTNTESLDDIIEAADRDAAHKHWVETAERYTFGLGLCFGVRAMLPVMAEAFVNLTLFALMRPEIRKDDRLRENMFRQPIDVRVRGLSVNCSGFAQPIDYASRPCADFHSLFNERNDLLHGNVAIEKLKFNDVLFWGKVPIFKQYRTMWERTFGVEMKVIGLSEVEREVAVVENFIDYILGCLKDKTRDWVKFMLSKSHLGINHEDGRLGMLFSDMLVDFRPGPRAEPSSGHQTVPTES